MERRLKEHIIGQEGAINTVASGKHTHTHTHLEQEMKTPPRSSACCSQWAGSDRPVEAVIG